MSYKFRLASLPHATAEAVRDLTITGFKEWQKINRPCEYEKDYFTLPCLLEQDEFFERIDCPYALTLFAVAEPLFHDNKLRVATDNILLVSKENFLLIIDELRNLSSETETHIDSERHSCDLDESHDQIDQSCLHAHEILELVRIYKTFDWNSNAMLFYGW